MAKFTNREDAFTIVGSHTFEKNNNTNDTQAENTNQNQNETKTETKVRKSKTTPKKQADNSETRAVTCYMPKDLFKHLRTEAFEQECSMTNLIIKAVEEYLDKHAKS